MVGEGRRAGGMREIKLAALIISVEIETVWSRKLDGLKDWEGRL